jgi:hypothetical protein
VAAVRQAGLTQDLILQIAEASVVVPPGGVVSLKYVLYSAEGNVEWIRLRLDAPPSWSLLDAELVEGERLLEAWEIVTGELRIALPAGASTGQRHLVRLTAEAVEEPGVAEALTHVHVLDGGGLGAGAAHLAGTTSLMLSQLEPSGLEGARVAGAIDLSGRLGDETYTSITYRQGRQENLSNNRYSLEEKYLSGSVRRSGWNVEFGNQVSSVGSALTGPSVNGEGIALRRRSGRVRGEAVLARPTTFSGEGGGHLWRGNVGLETTLGTIGIAASEFARPDGGYNTLPPISDPTLDPDSLEALERQRRLSQASASTRVQGLGLEAKLRLSRSHRLLMRGGTLRLQSARGEAVSAPSLEAHYSFSSQSATLNTRWRRMPPSVQGVYIPGNELSMDGSLRLISELRLLARAFQYENETLGDGYRSEREGASLGLRYAWGRWRVEMQGHQRDVRSSIRSLRRTGQLSIGLPIGPVSMNGSAELGEEEASRGTYPFRSYRSDLRWSGDAGFASLGVSSYETGGGPARLRADLLASVMVGEFELAGGAWATRGWAAGGEPGWWINVGLPVTSEWMLLLGVEQARDLLAPDASGWRTSFGLRKKLIVPLPFLPATRG